MPNVARVLKEEILRLAKKEAKSATRKLRAIATALKRRSAEQGRRMILLERDLAQLRKLTNATVAEAAAPSDKEVQRARISSGMVKRVRAKLGLSQADFGRLVGVSGISVYMWESKGGRLNLRNAARTAFLAARKLGKREAAARLAELKGSASAKPTGKRRGRKPTRR